MKSYLKFLSRNKLYTTIEAVFLASSSNFLSVAARTNPAVELKNE